MDIKKIIALFLSMVLCAGLMAIPVAADDSSILDDELTMAEEYVADSGVNDAAQPIADVEISESIDSIVVSEPETETIEMELPEVVETVDIAELVSSSAPIGNIADLEGMQELSVNQTRSRTINEFYQSVQGYITDPSQYTYVALGLADGYYLQVQMNLPNSAALDYDLILAVEISGGLYPLDSSSNRTLINGSNGTLPETVGWYNNTGATQNIYILAESYIGSSSTLPFTFHIAADTFASTSFDYLEPDAISNPIPITLPAANVTGELSIRSLLTKADNDWYRITVPASSTINNVSLGLDSVSNSLGHRVELYTLQNGKASLVSGTGVSAGGTYYIRVHTNQKQLKGGNYTLNISPSAPTPVLGRIDIPRMTIPHYSDDVGPVYLGTVKWEMYGTIEYDLGYITPTTTVLLLEFPAEKPNHMSGTEQFFISNTTKGEISLPYLYLSKNVNVYIVNDSWVADELIIRGSITSYGRN